MTTNGLDAYPEAAREPIGLALNDAFGSAPVDAITPIKGGASGASVFRIEVRGRRYVCRMEGDPGPLRNPHQYASMRIAADAGIAPAVRYVNETARIAVIDFVEGHSLARFPGGPVALAQALGDLLRRLQATPRFPRFVDYPDIVGRLWAYVCRTGLFAPGVLDAHIEHLSRIRENYTWDAEDSVSSHNDAIPGNILFDGRRLWLNDWESAYRNDPLVDVATMLDNLAPSAELENVLLSAWLGRGADERLLTRLTLIRALTRLYYAGVFLSASAATPRATPDDDLSAPSLLASAEHLRMDGTRRAHPKPSTFWVRCFLRRSSTTRRRRGSTPPCSTGRRQDRILNRTARLTIYPRHLDTSVRPRTDRLQIRARNHPNPS